MSRRRSWATCRTPAQPLERSVHPRLSCPSACNWGGQPHALGGAITYLRRGMPWPRGHGARQVRRRRRDREGARGPRQLVGGQRTPAERNGATSARRPRSRRRKTRRPNPRASAAPVPAGDNPQTSSHPDRRTAPSCGHTPWPIASIRTWPVGSMAASTITTRRSPKLDEGASGRGVAGHPHASRASEGKASARGDGTGWRKVRGHFTYCNCTGRVCK